MALQIDIIIIFIIIIIIIIIIILIIFKYASLLNSIVRVRLEWLWTKREFYFLKLLEVSPSTKGMSKVHNGKCFIRSVIILRLLLRLPY